ncbi:MAG: hypothetical protein MHM6MM_007603 [Cercozoa sp. M6MM]
MMLDGRKVDLSVIARESEVNSVVAALQCKLVAYWAVARPRLVDDVARYLRHFLQVELKGQLMHRLHEAFPEGDAEGATKLLPYFQRSPEMEARRRRAITRVKALGRAMEEVRQLRDSQLFDCCGVIQIKVDETENASYR